MYPAITPDKKDGCELLVSPSGTAVATLLDFWRWAYSGLMENSERGALAKFIVSRALGIDSSARIAWDKYDLLSNEGISIEVKTSGYLQTWEQKDLSKPIFGIQPTYGWDSKTNEYESVQKRQANIYVFCLHKHTDQATVNPLDLAQWEFYLMPTVLLDKHFGKQKTISLNALVRAGTYRCDYANLHESIVALHNMFNFT